MLKLAICDDNYNDIENCKRIVEGYNSAHTSRFSVKEFQYPATLRDEIVDGELFDVFILDIAMEALDGFSLAAVIRRYIPDAAIIFLSSHTDYDFTREGYKVQALRYVSKLAMEAGLTEALDAAARACRAAEDRYYTISHYNDLLRIPLDEIVCIRRVSRTTELITERLGRPVIRKPLKEVMRELNDARFIYTNKSCIVNGNFVVSVQSNALALRGGEVLPVSRKMMPAVKSGLLRLWGGLS